ncbi:MAG: hypothetical protein ACQESU_02365 [Halobacteriota archaeon]
MAKDLLDKCAILQLYKQTCAIFPQTPGDIVTPDELQRIVDVARKYDAYTLKFTINGVREIESPLL